jgi:flagellar protein FliO/FliZ
MSMAKLVIGLLLVMLIIWAASRWLKRRWPTAGGSGDFRLLGTLPLGPGKSVCVVEVAGRVLVLGVGQDVHLLEVIDDEKWLDKLRSEESMPSVKFDQRLSDALRQVVERRKTWLRRQRGMDEHE